MKGMSNSDGGISNFHQLNAGGLNNTILTIEEAEKVLLSMGYNVTIVEKKRETKSSGEDQEDSIYT